MTRKLLREGERGATRSAIAALSLALLLTMAGCGAVTSNQPHTANATNGSDSTEAAVTNATSTGEATGASSTVGSATSATSSVVSTTETETETKTKQKSKNHRSGGSSGSNGGANDDAVDSNDGGGSNGGSNGGGSDNGGAADGGSNDDTPTSTSTQTATSTPTETPTSTPTDTPTSTATTTPTSTATATPPPTPEPTPTPTATPTPTPGGPDATVTGYEQQGGEKHTRGDDVATRVRVHTTNLDRSPRALYVTITLVNQHGATFENAGTKTIRATEDANETHQIDYQIAPDAPTGTYDVVIRVYADRASDGTFEQQLAKRTYSDDLQVTVESDIQPTNGGSRRTDNGTQTPKQSTT